MIYLKNFKSIYRNAKILIRFLNQNGKTNLIENYLEIIHKEPIMQELMEGQDWGEKVICSFTASELYNNPKLPEALPLEVVNNMYYFVMLDTSEVKHQKDCPECVGGTVECVNCNGAGDFECDFCGGTGEVECEDCGGTGEDSDGEPCDTCQGGGYVECAHCNDGYITCDVCGGGGGVTCNNCDGTSEVSSEAHIDVGIYFYLSTDQELLKTIKVRSKNKEELNDIFKEMIEYNPKVMHIPINGKDFSINGSSLDNIEDYENGYYVTEIQPIKSISDLNTSYYREKSINPRKYFVN